MQSVSAIPQEREMGKAYRQFSRTRYQQLKATARNMRESDLIQVIIREWENMTSAQRKRFMAGNAIDPLGTPARIAQDRVPLDIKNKSNQKTTSRKPVSEQEEEERNEPMAVSDMMPGQRMMETPMKKSKMIRKGTERMRDYISFYRFHYRRISVEHPNWTSANISVIIGLKWKKEKAEADKERKGKGQSRVARQHKMSGRRLFNRVMSKGTKFNPTIHLKWKRLPQESRRMWDRRGDPSSAEADKSRMNTMVKLPQEGCELKQLMEKK